MLTGKLFASENSIFQAHMRMIKLNSFDQIMALSAICSRKYLLSEDIILVFIRMSIFRLILLSPLLGDLPLIEQCILYLIDLHNKQYNYKYIV